MSNRWIVALGIIAAAPAVAAAQFTTFIAPTNPVKDSIKSAVVAEQRAITDSITQAKIADMKTWVDSAAGIARVQPVDTSFPVPLSTAKAKPTTVVSDGMIAPATASPLPFLFVLGGSAMLLGLALLRRPQVGPDRADR